MKRFYLRFRIGLMTLSLGLSSFWFFDGMRNGLVEVPVILPKVDSDKIIVVFPRYRNEMPDSGGGGGGGKLYADYEVVDKAAS